MRWMKIYAGCKVMCKNIIGNCYYIEEKEDKCAKLRMLKLNEHESST